MMASMDDDILAAVGCVIAWDCLRKKRRKRVVWCKKWLLKRSVYSHKNLITELEVFPKDFHNYLRMDHDTYLHLLSLVTPFITKEDTVMRLAIPPHERLIATLRFLATGRSYEDLKYSTIISPQALGRIIPETCAAIYKVLRKDYLKFPTTEEEWKEISKGFEMKWNFPHCLGVMDGKHITIVPPADSGSEYFNYKGRHSMVLLGIADANYKFIMCDFGTNGRVSDGGVLKNTIFFEKLKNGLLNIPSADDIRNAGSRMPYVFVGDDAFPLRDDLMKPFRQADLTSHSRRIYNYRLSRARRIIENVFGILVARFRVFSTAINLKPHNIQSVVMACCSLHNFLMNKVPSVYAPTECFDYENTDGGTISEGYGADNDHIYGLSRNNRGNTTVSAKEIRDEFVDYFSNEGQVPWQMNFI